MYGEVRDEGDDEEEEEEGEETGAAGTLHANVSVVHQHLEPFCFNPVQILSVFGLGVATTK